MRNVIVYCGVIATLLLSGCDKVDEIINEVDTSTDTVKVSTVPVDVAAEVPVAAVQPEQVNSSDTVKPAVSDSPKHRSRTSGNSGFSKTPKEYYMSAAVKAKNGRYLDAIADYDKAIKIDPYYAEAYNARALLKDKINDFDGAAADYEKAIQARNVKNNKTQDVDDADIKNVTFNMQQGKIKIDLYDYDGADKDFTKAINIIPSYGPAYIARGDARLKLERYYDALSDYNKAMKFWPKLTYDALRKIGNLEMHFENYDKAVAAYRDVVDYDKNNVDSRYKLTDAFIMSGNFSEALNSIRIFYLISKEPYVYAGDYHRWNVAINKYKQDSTANELKSKINKLKIIKSN